jgi:hypothetical protein
VSSQTKTNVVLEQIRTRVRTSCYYNPNKILIAETTYYYRENNLHLIPNNKNINRRKIIKKRKNRKNGNRKNKVESKKINK